MTVLLGQNSFYRRKYEPLGWSASRLPGLDELTTLPFTTKAELVADQDAHPLFGSNLSYPLTDYTRLHQTSGTTGRPLRWLDTRESWQWFVDCWKEVYRAAGLTSRDRVFAAFSFGPFVGFWTGFEAAQQMGALAISGGGLSTEARLRTLLDNEATVLLSTPTYALRLAEVARQEGHDLAASAVRVSIHAGEPGASVPNVKRRLEESWGARVVDHAGATEVGAWGFTCGVADHMHVNEAEFLAEVIDAETGEPMTPTDSEACRGELVLTNLGRLGSPVVRYRTGDLVELVPGGCPCGRSSAYLPGGVLARIDNMVVVRGINVYPSAVENVVRELEEIDEFEVVVRREKEMSELVLRIEARRDPTRVGRDLARLVHQRLSLRPRVEVAEAGSLPRYELKARRFRVE